MTLEIVQRKCRVNAVDAGVALESGLAAERRGRVGRIGTTRDGAVDVLGASGRCQALVARLVLEHTFVTPGVPAATINEFFVSGKKRKVLVRREVQA